MPTSTVVPTSTTISATRPAAGDGTSVSILSVEMSTIGSSYATQSPGCLRHSTIVPSETETPIWGMTTSTCRRSVLEELTGGLLDAVDAGQDGLLERRRERDRDVRRRDPPTGPSRSSNARSAISAATWAPAAQVALASSTISDLAVLRTDARIASSSSGTSERRSMTSTDAPSRSSVASSAVWTIAP